MKLTAIILIKDYFKNNLDNRSNKVILSININNLLKKKGNLLLHYFWIT